ncbi:unnamed protein product [Caenorhabditis nigoni]
MTDVVTYLCHVLDHILANKKLNHTAKQISKQAGCAVAGTVVGGVLAGPIGAAVGSLVGTGVGYSVTDKYDGALQYIKKLSEEERSNLVQKVRKLVGGDTIESFNIWYKDPRNQTTVHELLLPAIGLVVLATKSPSKS